MLPGTYRVLRIAEGFGGRAAVLARAAGPAQPYVALSLAAGKQGAVMGWFTRKIRRGGFNALAGLAGAEFYPLPGSGYWTACGLRPCNNSA